MDAVQFIKEIGFYAAALVAIAWFIKRDVWPFCMRQIETRYSDSQRSHSRMLDLLDKLTDQVTIQRAQSIEAIHQLTTQMQALSETVAGVARLVTHLAERLSKHERPPK